MQCTWLLSTAKTVWQFSSSVLSGCSWFFRSSHIILVVAVVVVVVVVVHIGERTGRKSWLCCAGLQSAKRSQDVSQFFSLVLHGSGVSIILGHPYFLHPVFSQWHIFLVVKTAGQSWLCCVLHLVAQQSQCWPAVFLLHPLTLLKLLMLLLLLFALLISMLLILSYRFFYPLMTHVELCCLDN